MIKFWVTRDEDYDSRDVKFFSSMNTFCYNYDNRFRYTTSDIVRILKKLNCECNNISKKEITDHFTIYGVEIDELDLLALKLKLNF